jgi:hypothetical protein
MSRSSFLFSHRFCEKPASTFPRDALGDPIRLVVFLGDLGGAARRGGFHDVHASQYGPTQGAGRAALVSTGCSLVEPATIFTEAFSRFQTLIVEIDSRSEASSSSL